ncbi:unnamed protein product [Notodromas monacha]|uniref:Uncharacterized protein n=1 Tax=Notodromas monacha TaxID=399045 RepID=A0A7R9BJ17_9CRUS|nr:unnamed protein product [Notodromas monacha]CAG0914847.1 unnamed protein product [Notodromas monacha]
MRKRRKLLNLARMQRHLDLSLKTVTGILLTMIVIQLVLIYLHGTDSCKWLLTTGHLLSSLEWKPFGCRMHWYSLDDITACSSALTRVNNDGTLKMLQIVIWGDSRNRMTFNSLLDNLGKFCLDRIFHEGEYYRDEDKFLEMLFGWDPFLEFFPDFPGKVVPEIVIAGDALWYMAAWDGALQSTAIPGFKRCLRKWATKARKHANTTTFIWKLQYLIRDDWVPPITTKFPFISNPRMKEFNAAAIEVLTREFPEIIIWSSSESLITSLMTKGFLTHRDAAHTKFASEEYEAQIVWNLVCNKVLESSTGNDLCCNKGFGHSTFAVLPIIMSLLLLTVSLAVIRSALKWLLQTGHLTSDLRWQPCGCSMHWYSPKEAAICMNESLKLSQGNYIGFSGDSRVRNLYNVFVHMFGQWQLDWHIHANSSFHSDPLTVEFIWRSFASGVWGFPQRDEYPFEPTLIIVGSGLWYVEPENMRGKETTAFRRDLLHWIANLTRWTDPDSTLIIWKFASGLSHRHIPPPSFPVNTNAIMAEINSIAKELLSPIPNIIVWDNGIRVTAELKRVNRVIWRDYAHETVGVSDVETQMILNIYCNELMQFIDGTCCTTGLKNVLKGRRNVAGMINSHVTVKQVLCMIVFPYCVFLELMLVQRRMSDARDTCELLLQTGKFVKNIWTPRGCSMHIYSASEMKQCLRISANQTKKINYIGFIGDSRARDAYQLFAGHLTSDRRRSVMQTDLSTYDKESKTLIKFLWRPYLYQNSNFPQVKPLLNQPDLIVASGGAWYMMEFWNMKGADMVAFRKQMASWLNKMASRYPSSVILWKLQVQPSDTIKPPPGHKNITDAHFQAFNKIAQQTVESFNNDRILVWSNTRLIKRGIRGSLKHLDRDYLHPAHSLLEMEVQMERVAGDSRTQSWRDSSLKEP